MFFKGTKKRKNMTAVAEPLDKIGGLYNAFTSEEYTGYFVKAAAPHLELALDWVSDIYLNSSLPEKEIKKERGVIIEEINMIYDHPISYIGSLWNKLLYGDQPAGWDVAGTKESVAGISRQQILDYFKSQYVAKNTIICLAGKINPAEVIGKVKNYFSKIKAAQPKPKSPVIEKQRQPQCLIHSRKTDQTHLALGVRAYNLFHPRRYVQEIIGVILGGMMSSRLFVEIRGKLGIAYYIRTETSANPDAGYLTTSVGVDNKNIEKAILAILKEYKKITQKKVFEDELKKVKEHIKGKTTLLLESSDALAFFYAGQELLEKRVLIPEEIFKKIDQVSANDILKVAKDIFQPQKLNLVLIGPFENEEKFKKLLKL